jgi:hypothetical protein
MSELKITDEYTSEISAQFKMWVYFLNMGIGLVSFTLALACLGTKSPAFNAMLSLFVVVFVRYQGNHIFPAEIVRLREAAKLDQNARIVLNGLNAELLSFKAAVTGAPIFIIGYFLLFIIACSPWLTPILPILNSYIGI